MKREYAPHRSFVVWTCGQRAGILALGIWEWRKEGCCQKHKNDKLLIFMLLMIKRGTFFPFKKLFMWLPWRSELVPDSCWETPTPCGGPESFQAWPILPASPRGLWGPVCQQAVVSYFSQNHKREFTLSFCFFNNFLKTLHGTLYAYTQYKTVPIT